MDFNNARMYAVEQNDNEIIVNVCSMELEYAEDPHIWIDLGLLVVHLEKCGNFNVQVTGKNLVAVTETKRILQLCVPWLFARIGT